jgi:hypothetical protein
MPRFFKRLFKFPQMDFEMAIWEMTSLIWAPKKVFRSIYYHVKLPLLPPELLANEYTETYAPPAIPQVPSIRLTLPRNQKHLAPA